MAYTQRPSWGNQATESLLTAFLNDGLAEGDGAESVDADAGEGFEWVCWRGVAEECAGGVSVLVERGGGREDGGGGGLRLRAGRACRD